MLTVKVTAGLAEGYLTGAAEVFGGTVVVVVEMELRVDLFSRGEDEVDDTLSAVEADDGFLVVGVGLVLTALVEGERLVVNPELSVSELAARVDALVVATVVLGAAAVAVEEAVCAEGAKVLVGTARVTSTGEAFATVAFLAGIEVKEEGL